jgi:hypothetical protein
MRLCHSNGFVCRCSEVNGVERRGMRLCATAGASRVAFEMRSLMRSFVGIGRSGLLVTTVEG